MTAARRTVPSPDDSMRWGPAVLLCVPVLVVAVGAPGAGVALTPISAELHSSATSTAWVINGFMLTLAAFMGVAGSLTDRWGRRRTLTVGLLVFAGGSLLTMLAPQIVLAIAGRCLAGVGAAAVVTGGSALLATAYSDHRRKKAFALFGMTVGAGLSFGPLLSGLMIAVVGNWRGLFAGFVVLAILGVALSRMLPESHGTVSPRFDTFGAISFTASLTAFMLAVTLGPDLGWVSAPTIALLVAAAALLALFVRVELRIPHPMVDLGLLRRRRFLGVCLTPAVGAFAFVAPLFTLPTLFSAIYATSPAQAGLLLLFLTVPTLVVPLALAPVIHRIPASILLPGSLAVLAAGAAWLTTLAPHAAVGEAAAALAGSLMIIGAGFGAALAVLDGAAISSVPLEQAGMAAGVFNTVRMGAEATAVAVLVAIVATITTQRVGAGIAGELVAGHAAGGQVGTAALISAWHVAMWVVAAVCALGSATVAVLLRPAASPLGHGITRSTTGNRARVDSPG